MTDEQEQQLLELVKADAFYQELLDQYISVCEDLEYRRTCLVCDLPPQQ